MVHEESFKKIFYDRFRREAAVKAIKPLENSCKAVEH